MNAGINDLAATGLATTLGGPIFAVLCLAKLFGKIDVHWYWLAPFIQAYMVIGAILTFFGPQFGTTFWKLLATVFFLSVFFSTLVCTSIQFLTPAIQLRRGYKIDVLSVIKVVGSGYLILFSLAAILVYGGFQNENCMENARCATISLIAGYPHYNGSLFFPLLLCGTASTLAYVSLFAAREKEEKK